MNLPLKVGPMLSLADVAVVTKIDRVSQAEREVFRARIQDVAPTCGSARSTPCTASASIRWWRRSCRRPKCRAAVPPRQPAGGHLHDLRRQEGDRLAVALRRGPGAGEPDVLSGRMTDGSCSRCGRDWKLGRSCPDCAAVRRQLPLIGSSTTRSFFTSLPLRTSNCPAGLRLCGYRTCDEFREQLAATPELIRRCIHLSEDRVSAASAAATCRGARRRQPARCRPADRATAAAARCRRPRTCGAVAVARQPRPRVRFLPGAFSRGARPAGDHPARTIR